MQVIIHAESKYGTPVFEMYSLATVTWPQFEVETFDPSGRNYHWLHIWPDFTVEYRCGGSPDPKKPDLWIWSSRTEAGELWILSNMPEGTGVMNE